MPALRDLAAGQIEDAQETRRFHELKLEVAPPPIAVERSGARAARPGAKVIGIATIALPRRARDCSGPARLD